MQVVAIIQARLGSSRLPGKVFTEISGKTLLWHMLNRVKLSKRISGVVLAIPDSESNDPLEDFARNNGLQYFRGSEEDVLYRYYGAAEKYPGEVVVRLTSDCPLIDPRIMDIVIEAHLNSGYDYTATSKDFPLGLSTEVFNFGLLERMHREARQGYEREHVTPYAYQHPDLFKIGNVDASQKLKRPELRLTVDTEEDLKLVREIFRHLYVNGKMFYTEDVIDLLDNNPELLSINAHVKQKELGQ